MTSKKFFYVLVSVFVLMIVGSGALLYFGNTILKDHSSDIVDLKLQSYELEEQQRAYAAAKKDVDKYSYLNDIIKNVVPKDKDQARTVQEIFLLGQASGITIKTVQFPSSNLGAKLAPAAGAAAGATPTPTPAVPPVSQAKPVEGLTGVYAIEATVTPISDNKTSKVTYSQLLDFLDRIESNRRAMQVTSITILPQGLKTTDGISFTLTVNIFIKP